MIIKNLNFKDALRGIFFLCLLSKSNAITQTRYSVATIERVPKIKISYQGNTWTETNYWMLKAKSL
jgi:hypothetical protein